MLISSLTNIRQRYASYQYVLVGADFYSDGGAWRSIHLFYRHLQSVGTNVLLVDLRRSDGWRQWLCAVLFSPRIIVNGMAALSRRRILLGLRFRLDVAVYPHDTTYTLNALQLQNPRLYRKLASVFRDHVVFCVSKQMADLYLERFGVINTRIVYEATDIQPVPALQPGSVHIVMVGTLCRRKGYSLFVKTAQLANQQGLPWEFHWIGGLGESDLAPVSQAITWWGWRDSAAPIIRQADVMFLSSIDDPQPLASLEALALGKRVVAYSGTGTAEIVEHLPGCRVYSRHEAPAAIDAIKAALQDQHDHAAISKKLEEIAGIDGFARRVEMAFVPLLSMAKV